MTDELPVPPEEDQPQTADDSSNSFESGKPRNLATITAASMEYSGPVPHPAILKGYEEIVPGSAKQIMDQAKRQTDHRIDLEKRLVASGIWRSYLGLSLGALIALTCTLGGCILVYLDHDTAGATIATASVIGLASVFVYGSRLQVKEPRQNTKAESE